MGIVGKMSMVGKRYNTHSTQITQITQNPHKTLPDTLSPLLLSTPPFFSLLSAKFTPNGCLYGKNVVSSCAYYTLNRCNLKKLY